MQRVRRAVVLLLLAPVVVLPARTAAASRVEPAYTPLLEALARGKPLPDHVDGPGGPRALTADDRAAVEELVRAHVTNDPAPFRKALREGPPWLVRVALEAIAITRVDAEHVRREDEAFVRAFLPDLVRLARHPDLRLTAMDALGALALRSLDEEARSHARIALLEAVAEAGDSASLGRLGDWLGTAPGFEVPEGQRPALRAVLAAHLDHPPASAWRVAAAVASEDLVALVRAHVEQQREQGSAAGDAWLPFLAAVAHADTPALVAEALARPRRPGSGANLGAALTAAEIRPDPAYLPALESFTPGAWDGPLTAIAAIETPTARALVVRWAMAGSHTAARRWFAFDREGALPWLRAQAREGKPSARARALALLAEAEDEGVLPMLDALLRQKESRNERWALLEVLADVVRRSADPAARELARAQARTQGRDTVVLLEALHHAEPEQLESVLLERLRALPAAPDWHHVTLLQALGRAGGARSLGALAEWTRWRAPADPDVYDIHVFARQAIGRIERRLGR